MALRRLRLSIALVIFKTAMLVSHCTCALVCTTSGPFQRLKDWVVGLWRPRIRCINPRGLALPPELYYRIAQFGDLHDCTVLARVSVAVNDVASDILYHYIFLTEETAADHLLLFLSQVERPRIPGERQPLSRYVRVLSYESLCPVSDIRCLPMLARAIQTMEFLQFLRIDVPDRSISRAVMTLAKYGISRATPRLAPSFCQAAGRPTTLQWYNPALDAVHVRSVEVMEELTMMRALRVIIIDTDASVRSLLRFIREYRATGRGPIVESFKCSADYDRVEEVLDEVSLAFPNLTHLGLQQHSAITFPPSLASLHISLWYLTVHDNVLTSLRAITYDPHWCVCHFEGLPVQEVAYVMEDVASSRPDLVRLYVACCLFTPTTSKGKPRTWRVVPDGTDSRERARYMSARLTANFAPTGFDLTW
ncbi:hypothetical protein C8Q76DRAFT_798991 [Earliella scabrosa]|nr:hypothetical protein C8Q76DRAFT_798991 [Earliella scabrosa]